MTAVEGRRLFAVLAVLLVLPVTAASAGSSADAAPLRAQSIDADNVLLTVAIDENGSAAWTISYRIRLDTENETAAFESLRADVAANRTAYREQFAGRMRATVADAANATGRSMEVENVSLTVETRELGQRYGVVSYRFEWTNFAVVDGDRIRAGDALAGFFLDGETSLHVEWPHGYQPSSLAPDPDERRDDAAVWYGPLDFGPDEPRIALDRGGLPVSPAVLVASALIALIAAAAGYRLYGRRGDATGSDGATAGPPADAADPADAGEGASAASVTEPPEELLSNEERVFRLLRDNGGRVRQQEIVSDLDWTAAKTSQVIGEMRDDDRIEVFRLGRENVVRLPGSGPAPVPDSDEEPEESG